MIRHIAVFRFIDPLPEGMVDRVDEALASLPDAIDAIGDFVHGRDIAITGEAWDYAVVADFASPQAYTSYAEHPAHVKVVSDVIKPILTEAARIQIEL